MTAMTDKTFNLPWENIKAPAADNKFTMLRAKFDGKPVSHNIYFAVDRSGSYYLLYMLPQDCRESFDQTMSGISVRRLKMGNGAYIAALELQKKEDGKLFYDLCRDICGYVDKFSEEKGPKAFVSRLLFLQKFLKPKNAGTLNYQQQQGLAAELLVLLEIFFKHYDKKSAVQMWCGAEDLHQDFACSDYLMEVKSILKPHNNEAVISSQEQLELSDKPLYLAAVYLDKASPDSADSFSLYSLIDAVQSELAEEQDALDDFNEKLNNKIPNIILDTDLLKKYYDQYYFSLTNIIFYAVNDDFPKITKDSLHPAVTKISYVIDLDQCTDFIADSKTFLP